MFLKQIKAKRFFLNKKSSLFWQGLTDYFSECKIDELNDHIIFFTACHVPGSGVGSWCWSFLT